MTFKKILIANRGEIACRIIKTARKMGITTVAVYSEADRRAKHVRLADEAVYIGASPASQSYLLMDNIIKACKDTGADAVHPGFGFLSENCAFARALEDNDIIFIGPPIEAVDKMGDKITSKLLAQEVGVNVIAGFTGIIEDTDHALRIAEDIGYPIMLKASAGGGGKGMRIAHTPDEIKDALSLAKAEAKASFGDDRIFLEKYIENPRHIEIQLLGDKYGNIVHLFERECSLQRRHQKVIEEAPSAYLLPETRQKMAEQAINLAKAVGYYSAGTVEFITDQKQNFFFLEMNTRIQVEHPVTELITGLDLIEQMIKVAAGEKLAFTQEDIQMTGHAIEARVYAEDPARHFAPSTGRLRDYNEPSIKDMPPNVTLRIDSGVEEGDDISVYYDPMIAKICTHAETRLIATRSLMTALDHYCITGIKHNICFLSALLGTEPFQNASLSTHLIADTYPQGFTGRTILKSEYDILAVITTLRTLHDHKNGYLDYACDKDYRVDFGEAGKVSHQVSVTVKEIHFHTIMIECNEKKYEASLIETSPFITKLLINDSPYYVQTSVLEEGYKLSFHGIIIQATLRSLNEAIMADYMLYAPPPDGSKFITAQTPGILKNLLVEVGDKVTVGSPLAVLEAMKMENMIFAQKTGIVEKIYYAVGDNIPCDKVIMVLEDAN